MSLPPSARFGPPNGGSFAHSVLCCDLTRQLLRGEVHHLPSALTKALADGVDLAKGLSGTTAFSQQTRSDIEVQLSEGLALSENTLITSSLSDPTNSGEAW